MIPHTCTLRPFSRSSLLTAFALATWLAVPAATAHGQAKIDLLRIGTTGTLTGTAASPREKSALETLHHFIKEETGLDNEIVRLKDWQELADKLAKGELHMAVCQGYEFAWARERHAQLKPLALAINVHRYPVACVVAQRDSPAKDFAGLQGLSLSQPVTSQGYLRLFVERQSEAGGKKAAAFFSKTTSPENVEDALDDVVDGVVQAAVVDRAALEAYKRRKPGRFNRLKEVAHSQPFPPAVVAYYGAVLDEATLRRFKDRLLAAADKEKGETLLTLSRLSGFVSVPADFDKVLAETRKAYPPPKVKQE